MIENQTGLNRGLSSSFSWLGSTNNMKCTCAMCVMYRGEVYLQIGKTWFY